MRGAPDWKVVLVTGATRGIGFAAARELVSRGCRVVITSRDPARAESAAGELGCDWLALDLTDRESVAGAAQEFAARYGRLDVLVNNSAILLDHYSGLMELEPEQLRDTLETNRSGRSGSLARWCHCCVLRAARGS